MDLFYKVSLSLHSWNRYAILASGLAVIWFALNGLRQNTPYGKPGQKSMYFYISSLHFQLLMGILLYFFASPITTHALSDFSSAMKDPVTRYWSMEHATVNFIAIALAQTGSILIKRRKTDREKHRRALIWASVTLFLIILMIPMGIMGVSRPWFRF